MASMSEAALISNRSFAPVLRALCQAPIVIWLVVIAFAAGLSAGLPAERLTTLYNAAFGSSLGDFFFTLLCAFTLAAALSGREASVSAVLASGASPFMAAAMICPDTAYVTLAPAAGQRKLSAAFGAYAGFKLLFPAGPLLVATGMGVAEASLLIPGALLLAIVWPVGEAWARFVQPAKEKQAWRFDRELLALGAPFIVHIALLAAGLVVTSWPSPVLDWLTTPKGALFAAAFWALIALAPDRRIGALASAVTRTGGLLLVIGAASALGGVLSSLWRPDVIADGASGTTAIVLIFAIAAAFKLLQGSSMATFAAVAPVVAPFAAQADLPAAAAVFATCLGSFVTIAPNDSFYWLVRRDALAGRSNRAAVAILGVGAALQASAGLCALIGLYVLNLL
jgi:GntP family gluconate:H+ symporter